MKNLEYQDCAYQIQMKHGISLTAKYTQDFGRQRIRCIVIANLLTHTEEK